MIEDINKKLHSKAKITKNLTQNLYKHTGLNITILEIEFMDKKFIIERRFQNNLAGRDELDKAIKEFDSEDKLKEHFGLK